MNVTPFAVALTAVLAVGGAACARPAQVLAVSAVGTSAARQSRYMSGGGVWVEYTPEAVHHDAVRDDATLARFSGGFACFDLSVRTAVGYDEPIDALDPKCKTEEGTAPASVSQERVGVSDYGFTERRETAHVHEVVRDVEGARFRDVTLTAPSHEVFRVVERTAQVCCSTSGGREVRLRLTSARMRINDVGTAYTEEFAFRVQ